MQPHIARAIALAVSALIMGGMPAVAAAATPTPIPGGANQLKGVSGGLSSTLFNGRIRIRQMRLRTSTPDEATPDAGRTALTLLYLVSNGTNVERGGNFTATMADADGITIAGHPVSVYSATYGLDPGASARNSFFFTLPAGYVPVKILLTDGAGLAFRIMLKASDLPAPAPVATPSP